MTKIAVILAEGFEEIEALAPVDILRRAGLTCDLIGLTSQQVTGSHGIEVVSDATFSGNLSAYDMIILPGGMPGTVHLRDHDGLIHSLQAAAEQAKWLAAICAAPIVLDRAGVLEGHRYTCYPGKEKEITSGEYVTQAVVVDGRVITAKGAGTSFDFAYQLVDLLGGDSRSLRESMLYSLD